MITMDMSWRDLLKFRSDLNEVLHVEEVLTRSGTALDENGHQYPVMATNDYRLVVQVGNVIRRAHINNRDDSQEEFDKFKTNILPLSNKTIEQLEVRFKTHDFSDKSDWDGRTHGDQTAYLASGIIKHPVDGSWLDSTGAGMIVSYGTPDSPHYQDPSYLFGALEHRITAKYDDVNYQWLTSDNTRISFLDTSVNPSVWKSNDLSEIVHYNGTEWIRNDNLSVVTTSLWRILPYPGYKIQINQVSTQFDETVEFGGTLHYLIYMNLDANVAGYGYPAANYKVKDFAYSTRAEIQAGSDRNPYVEPMIRPGHSGAIMTLTYDYNNTTVPQVIDDALGMHLDIVTDGHIPCSNTLGAHATFICLKVRSF